MEELTTFGKRLKHYRKAKKLSGEELGRIIGTNKGQISYVENDKALPTLEGFIKLLNAFPELDGNWLACGVGEMLKVESMPQNSLEAANCWKLLELERAKSNTYLDLLRNNNIKIE
ncbi:helix-turn-helix domain-containing protein [Adhaeribacter radiodurans]|uniref:Helix-turn-helix transcriptional regulator n=1 Tax=Adhaeribacter radiodurans TaxID=2745197 RepID=A0A7L7LBD4_9BACT|nr:helix-turn-helix transcriptional regulator [Adhaeribacter radiodurans]QMU30158.1 helix-turn-helix transcriptional regulator [Adhaeribacter radiodurans]